MVRDTYRQAGAPEDVAVYHEFTKDRHNLFYFSPGCAAVFRDLLKFFKASPSEQPPLYESLTRVLGPTLPPAEQW